MADTTYFLRIGLLAVAMIHAFWMIYHSEQKPERGAWLTALFWIFATAQGVKHG